MTTFIIRRIFLGLIVLILTSVLIFLLMRVLPGDPLAMHLGHGGNVYTQEEVEFYREQFGLNDPLVVQYFNWIGGVVQGDFGRSVSSPFPVGTIIKDKLPVTLNLAFLSIVLSGIVGPLLGTIAAIRRTKWQDTTVSILANLGITLPNFWVGIVLLYIFAGLLGWVPYSGGYVSPTEDFVQHLRLIVLPVFCMSLFGTAAQTRQARSAMLEVSHQDYIRTAWSKGLGERVIVFRHMLKNGLIPVVTTLGIQVGFLFGGAVLVETVFNIPGLGRMLADGVANNDYQVVQGGVLVMSVIIVVTNILVDISYAWLDPRIRHSYR